MTISDERLKHLVYEIAFGGPLHRLSARELGDVCRALEELRARRRLARAILPPALAAGEPVDDLQTKIEAAKAAVATMPPEEQEAMYRAQRESFARGMSPCEHGVADWEDCPKCRAAGEVK